ncbi:MAG: HAMP domain-containing sensor histidine kinase [Cyclobacteriaceae bacterium]
MFFWESNYVLEKQIFNATLIIVFFYLLAMMIFNFIIGNSSLIVVSLLGMIMLFFCFYQLRKRNRYKLAYYLFGGFSYFILALGFFFNDGILGPTLYILISFHLVMLSISPNRKFLFWSLINGMIFLFLLYLGVFYAERIPNTYVSDEMLYIDHSLTYLASLAGIAIVVRTFKKFYDLQKNKVKDKSQELVVLNRSLSNTSSQKDRIITIISHDLKNPLQSIMQTLELINQGGLDQEEIDFLHEELLKITTRTYRMMENILDWSSFEIKNQRIHIRKIDMKKLFEDTIEILKVIAKQKGVHISISYLKNPTVKLETDRLLLILRNLVQNAIKFTEINGNIDLEINEEEDEVTVMVMDTGIGIPKERLEHIFELDIKSTYGTEQEKGTGMGLHLCYQNAKKLGGDIRVRSEEGKGSIFTLKIPTGLKNKGNSLF